MLHLSSHILALTELASAFELATSFLSMHATNIVVAGTMLIIVLLMWWALYNWRASLKYRRINQELMAAERTKLAFIRSLCEELRIPINTISGYSSMIAADAVSQRTKERMVDDIERQTNLLTSIIDDLLSVAMLDATDSSLPLEPGALKPELEKLIAKYKDLRPYATFILSCDALPIVRTNIPYLIKAIDSLLANVAKHCPADTHCTLACTYRRGWLSILCEDDGPGIPVEMRECVFQRFTKLNDYVPGAGLGLYLCRLVMDRLSGSIEIDSKYNEGTRMKIQVPALSVDESDIVDPEGKSRGSDISITATGREH